MATMTEPKIEKKTLVHCLVEGGVAIIELDDPPANTYTHDMMRQLDEAILQARFDDRSEEHTSELQSRLHLVCRLLLEKKKKKRPETYTTTSETRRHTY